MKTLLFFVTFLTFSISNNSIEKHSKAIVIAFKNDDGSYKMNQNVQHLLESANKFLKNQSFDFKIDNVEITQDHVEDSEENYIFLLLTSQDKDLKLVTRIFEKNRIVYAGTEQQPIQNFSDLWLAPNAVVCHGCIKGCTPKLYKFESELNWFCTDSETDDECSKLESIKLAMH